MNAPDRFELYLMPDGVQKLKFAPDGRLPNAAIIKFVKEDHTLANLIKCQLLLDKRVIFSAYKIDHPLFATFTLRVQTEDGYDPREALKNAAVAIIKQFAQIESHFIREWEIRKVANEEEERAQQEENMGEFF